MRRSEDNVELDDVFFIKLLVQSTIVAVVLLVESLAITKTDLLPREWLSTIMLSVWVVLSLISTAIRIFFIFGNCQSLAQFLRKLILRPIGGIIASSIFLLVLYQYDRVTILGAIISLALGEIAIVGLAWILLKRKGNTHA